MVRIFFLLLVAGLPCVALCQSPIYEYRDLEQGNFIPATINDGRTCVIVGARTQGSNPQLEGDWKKLSAQIHASFRKMGIDAVLYLNANDLNSGNSTRAFYQNSLVERRIENLIFFTDTGSGFQLVCTKYSGKDDLIANGQQVYFRESTDINRMMIGFAREIKRLDLTLMNFLIPERPTYLDGISIVEKLNLKNYPGQIRRSKLAVEKFQPLAVPESASESLKAKMNDHNLTINQKNEELEKIINQLPYDIELIEYLTDEDLLRKRYQFVLRNVSASAASIKSMLKYKPDQSDAGFVSVIPIMPDNTSIKTFSRNAILHKFYIRQNIAKNVYVGEWDADETWQKALENYIGNMLQFFNKGN